jgi:hypothetical protein
VNWVKSKTGKLTMSGKKVLFPGDQLPDGEVYSEDVAAEHCPETALDSMDYSKRLRFEELKKSRLEALQQWKQKDVKGLKKNAYIKEIQKKNNKILTVDEKNDLEKLEVYTDRFPLLRLRKQIRKVLILIHMVANAIINTKIFENASITVILVNSLFMIFDDPT